MNKIKFLGAVIIGLLISNIALIIFLVCHHPPHPEHPQPKNAIIEKLGFDDTQVKAYEQLIEWHQNEIIQTEKKILNLKNQLYSNLAVETGIIKKDSLINEISKVQVKIENIHYKHFEDLNKLCKANQKQAFKNLTLEIATIFSHASIKHRK